MIWNSVCVLKYATIHRNFPTIVHRKPAGLSKQNFSIACVDWPFLSYIKKIPEWISDMFYCYNQVVQTLWCMGVRSFFWQRATPVTVSCIAHHSWKNKSKSFSWVLVSPVESIRQLLVMKHVFYVEPVLVLWCVVVLYCERSEKKPCFHLHGRIGRVKDTIRWVRQCYQMADHSW